jgi:hypothetical protein
MRKGLLAAAVLALALCGCRTARQAPANASPAWDETARPAAGMEDYFESIREGAAAPGILRGSGGCGCN